MSRLGGVAVMPHRTIRSTAKASPVRKKAPTFWAERTLSSTTVTGIFSIAANSSAEGLPSSSLVILRIMGSERLISGAKVNKIKIFSLLLSAIFR